MPHTTLGAAQFAEYYERGYVVVEDVFRRAELDEINREMDHILEGQAASKLPANTYAPAKGWIMSLGLVSPRAAKVCADERILKLIEDIVKPGIAIYSAKLVSKEPFDTTICHWHQDDAYYVKNSQSETRMSIWLPLHDADRENGCLQVIPGSHKRGLQAASYKEGGTCNLGIDTRVNLENRVYLPVSAGSIVLFSALLWHASDGNTSSNRRRAFIVSYQEAAAQGGNANQWIILRPA